jgi:glyoxylate/hydroxypyruvate reductase A
VSGLSGPLVLFASTARDWSDFEAPLREALAAAGVAARLVTAADPAAVDYIVYAPGGGLEDFAPFTRARAVLSLWAGVERIVDNPTLTVPLARMVDPGMTQHMAAYVAGHVLRHHLGTDAHVRRTAPVWEPRCPPPPSGRPVAMLGLGELGRACARVLVALGFPVHGWSRSPRRLPGVTARHGEDGLRATLGAAEIVVTLLPRTAETENLLDARRIGWMRPGAVLVNPGRGALVDEAALIAALDAGHLAHATLDVFRTEPLPATHPFWTHPKVTVTPHIAADTHPATAARVVAENIRRGEAGEPFLHLVDRGRGY